jgi:hypothetical protein
MVLFPFGSTENSVRGQGFHTAEENVGRECEILEIMFMSQYEAV